MAFVGPTIGTTGFINSWAGTFNTHLISTGNIPIACELEWAAEELPTTPFAAAGTINATSIPGVRQWGGTIPTLPITPVGPGGSSLTFANGYATNVRAWTLVFERSELDLRTATSDRWLNWAPGIVRTSGSYEALMDGTTLLSAPGKSGEPATMVLTLTSGNTFTCTGAAATGGVPALGALTTQLRGAIRPDEPNVFTYDFAFSGNVTTAGSTNIIPSGTFALPDWPLTDGNSLLTVKAHETTTSDILYYGQAFWTRIEIVRPFVGLATISVRFRGSGNLTSQDTAGATAVLT